MPEIEMMRIGRQELRVARWRGAGKARPILFFNGIGANLELVNPLGEMLRDRSDVITFDMPGIGGSANPVVPYRPSTVVSWSNQILDAHGIDDVDVMGVSWGGGAAQQYAWENPERARSLVLLATSAGMVMVPGNIGALSKMASPRRYIDPNYMMSHFETLYGDFVDNSTSDYSARIHAPTRRGYMYQLMAMLGWTSIHYLPFLRQPTLVMSGDKDTIVPLANGRILKSAIPRADLKIVKGGGHLFVVSRAKQIIPVIARYLDDHANDYLESSNTKPA